MRCVRPCKRKGLRTPSGSLIESRGEGGSYGFPMLSEVARLLELAARARDAGGAAAALAGVKEVCVAIQAGWTGQTRETGQP